MKLETGALADLEVGGAKPLTKVIRGEPDEVAALGASGLDRRRHSDDRLGDGRAGGDKQQGGYGEAAHRSCVAGRRRAGKLAARAARV